MLPFPGNGFLLLVPLVCSLRTDGPLALAGLLVYGLGACLYFASWAVQIMAPASRLGANPFARAAPAHMSAPWLAGIALLCRDAFGFEGAGIVYGAIALCFAAVHTARAIAVGKSSRARE